MPIVIFNARIFNGAEIIDLHEDTGQRRELWRRVEISDLL